MAHPSSIMFIANATPESDANPNPDSLLSPSEIPAMNNELERDITI